MTAPACASSAASSGVRGDRWKAWPLIRVTRYLGCPRPAEAAQNRDHAQRLCLRVRGLRHVPRLLGTARGSDRAGRRNPMRRRCTTSATTRWCSSTAAMRSSCRRARGHPVPAGIGQADRGAGGMVRPDRDEHARTAPPGHGRTAHRRLHQTSLKCRRTGRTLSRQLARL